MKAKGEQAVTEQEKGTARASSGGTHIRHFADEARCLGHAAPADRCASCGSDDLMRLMPPVVVLYGTDWCVAALIREHLTAVDTEAAFAQSVSDCYSKSVTVGWTTVDVAA